MTSLHRTGRVRIYQTKGSGKIKTVFNGNFTYEGYRFDPNGKKCEKCKLLLEHPIARPCIGSLCRWCAEGK